MTASLRVRNFYGGANPDVRAARAILSFGAGKKGRADAELAKIASRNSLRDCVCIIGGLGSPGHCVERVVPGEPILSVNGVVDRAYGCRPSLAMHAL